MDNQLGYGYITGSVHGPDGAGFGVWRPLFFDHRTEAVMTGDPTVKSMRRPFVSFVDKAPPPG
jgi:hypothetical protein